MREVKINIRETNRKNNSKSSTFSSDQTDPSATTKRGDYSIDTFKTIVLMESKFDSDDSF